MSIYSDVDIDAIVKRIGPVAREYADQSERERNLAQPVVDVMIEQKAFKTMTPKSLGGLELDPVSFHRIVEDLSVWDASTGWCVWIPGAGSWASSDSDDDVAEERLGPVDACGAGALFPPGRAVPVEGGYMVTGRWPYCSGSGHSTTLGGFCNVYENDTLRMSPFGMPEMRAVSVRRDEAQILDTWHVNGLAGTGSHDVLMENLFVPEKYTRAIGPAPKGKHFQSPIYNYPFLAIFGSPIGSVATGIARAAIDEAMRVGTAKKPAMADVTLRDRPVFQLYIADAIASMNSAKAWHMQEVDSMWKTVAAGGVPDIEARARLTLASTHATRSAAHAVQLAYTACGGSANYKNSPLQRMLRDVQATTQHAGTSPHNLETSAKLLLGLPPDNPMIFL
jgi:alkylation response protein AidB-like acyl-CoA dehydrogenase